MSAVNIIIEYRLLWFVGSGVRVVGVGEGEGVLDGGGVVYANIGAVECLLLWTVVEGVDGVQ